MKENSGVSLKAIRNPRERLTPAVTASRLGVTKRVVYVLLREGLLESARGREGQPTIKVLDIEALKNRVGDGEALLDWLSQRGYDIEPPRDGVARDAPWDTVLPEVAAVQLKVSTEQVKNYMGNGRLPEYFIGSVVYTTQSGVAAFDGTPKFRTKIERADR